ncbi:MAG: hypothetical protein IJ889_06755 [Eubacterium sp.]|nr:hypothetical protein [Eubacterium sp.]MBR2214105.1 hypothetical protein [Eubacterium sp.]MBR2247457.1 hypothetical protein [Bacilli bacterium]
MELNFKECFQSREYQVARKEFEEHLKEETTYIGGQFYTDYDELQHILCSYYPEETAIRIMNNYEEDPYGIFDKYELSEVGFEREFDPRIIPRIQKYNECLYSEIRYNNEVGIMPKLDVAYKCAKIAMEKMQDRMLDWNMAFSDDHLGYYKNYNGRIIDLNGIEKIGHTIYFGSNALYNAVNDVLSTDAFRI